MLIKGGNGLSAVLFLDINFKMLFDRRTLQSKESRVLLLLKDDQEEPDFTIPRFLLHFQDLRKGLGSLRTNLESSLGGNPTVLSRGAAENPLVPRLLPGTLSSILATCCEEPTH